MLRNNNKIMLKLINNCNEENFELLSDYIVNFCFEDTINSSFIQEELMLFIYLIFEKYFFENLPDEIKINDNKISYNILRSKNNILYYIIKSLTRKADIRNFLCNILLSNILKLEGIKKYLLPEIFSSEKLEDEILQENNPTNEIDPPPFVKQYTINQDRDSKLSLNLNTYKIHNLSKCVTIEENILIENFEDIKNNSEKKNQINNIDVNNKINNNNAYKNNARINNKNIPERKNLKQRVKTGGGRKNELYKKFGFN